MSALESILFETAQMALTQLLRMTDNRPTEEIIGQATEQSNGTCTEPTKKACDTSLKGTVSTESHHLIS